MRELAEVVGAARPTEKPRQVGGHRVVVEEAVRQPACQAHERFDDAARRRRAEIGERRSLHELRHPHQPPRELAERRTHQQVRFERIVVRPVENEHCVHLAGRDAVGETRSDKGARAHADIDIQIRQPDASQRLFQRDQRADLIDSAQGTAPSEGDPHLSVATPPVHCTTPSAPRPAPGLPASCGEFTRLLPCAHGRGRGPLPLLTASW